MGGWGMGRREHDSYFAWELFKGTQRKMTARVNLRVYFRKILAQNSNSNTIWHTFLAQIDRKY
jgi:hypothetical protein